MEYIYIVKIIIKSTKIYDKDVSKLLSPEDREKLENEIALDPLYWPVIRGTGGIRKARFSRDGMGKRSGGRVCYYYLQINETVYMLKAYAKNDKEDLSEKEKKKIKQVVEQILKIMEE
jgi:hypothetical protein